MPSTSQALLMAGGGGAFTPTLCVPDPYWNSVVLMLHMDGVNGSRVYVDSSSYSRTITELGINNLSSSVVKFGTASAQFNNGAISTVDSSSMELGSGAWTIEFWLHPTVNAPGLLCKYTNGVPPAIPISISCEGSTGTEKIRVRISSDGLSYGFNQLFPASGGGAYTQNVWAHIAITYDGTSIRVFRDGVVLGTQANSTAVQNTADPWYIGKDFSTGAFLTGYIDEFRMTAGVARYTANFTPASLPFCNGATGGTAVSGTAYLTGASTTVSRGTTGIQNPYFTRGLTGASNALLSGNLTPISSTVSRALTGVSAAVSLGAVIKDVYPPLVRTYNDVTVYAKALPNTVASFSITFFPSGVWTVDFPNSFYPSYSGRWIGTLNDITSIANGFQVQSITAFAFPAPTANVALPALLSSPVVISIESTAGWTRTTGRQQTLEFQVNLRPSQFNPNDQSIYNDGSWRTYQIVIQNGDLI